jgi:outer membrane protein assembly factor BamB
VIVSNSIGRVTAFDSKSGIEKWQFQVPAGIRHEPVLVADQLALVDLNGQLHLLKPAQGKLDTSRALADFGPLISTEDGLVILGRTSVFKRTLSAWNEP